VGGDPPRFSFLSGAGPTPDGISETSSTQTTPSVLAFLYSLDRHVSKSLSKKFGPTSQTSMCLVLNPHWCREAGTNRLLHLLPLKAEKGRGRGYRGGAPTATPRGDVWGQVCLNGANFQNGFTISVGTKGGAKTQIQRAVPTQDLEYATCSFSKVAQEPYPPHPIGDGLGTSVRGIFKGGAQFFMGGERLGQKWGASNFRAGCANKVTNGGRQGARPLKTGRGGGGGRQAPMNTFGFSGFLGGVMKKPPNLLRPRATKSLPTPRAPHRVPFTPKRGGGGGGPNPGFGCFLFFPPIGFPMCHPRPEGPPGNLTKRGGSTRATCPTLERGEFPARTSAKDISESISSGGMVGGKCANRT